MYEPRTVVVICVDGSKHSDYALKYYKDHIHHPDNRVYALYCAHYHAEHWHTFSMMPADHTIIKTMIEEDTQKIIKVIHHVKEIITDLELNADIVKIHGHPGHNLLEKATELGANMIVMGSRGVGTVRRTILGSISDYVVHHAHVPVVVCKHPHHVV